MMESTDRELLLSINGRLITLEAEQSGMQERMNALIQQQERIADRLEWMQTTIYWGFAIIALIVGLFTLWLSTPKARKHEDPPHSPSVQPVIIQIPPYPQPEARQSA